MSEVESIDNIEAARQFLRVSLEKTKELSTKLDGTGSKLEEINQRLPSLEASIKSIPKNENLYLSLRDQIDCAIGPVAAVMKVHGTARELESFLLSNPHSDLSTYLLTIRRLEEALRLLASTCGLAIQWLEGILEFLESNAVSNDQCLLNVKKSLSIIKELRALEGRARVDGGILNAAFDRLETEFSRLLTENAALLSISSSSSFSHEEACNNLSALQASVIQKLRKIAERLNANDRVENCIPLYIKVRVSNARRSLQSLDLEYLDMDFSEVDDIRSIQDHIEQWGKHLELAVKHLFELEYKLCNSVFEKIGSDTKMDCFARIAIESGIISFLQFGKNVTNIKKDPFKLLKLLDIFKVLNNLRSDFNRIFGWEACSEIQTLTRDLIEKVVDSICEIFWELPIQVEAQRRCSSPQDGGVPKLVSFVTDYCNQLLGDEYKPILIQVLAIYQSWKKENYEEGILLNQFHNIMKEIGLNLDAWSKTYLDISLSYLFMMNNHCHFYNLKGTKLGDLMGDSWLGAHEQYKDYYAALYLKESWGNLLPILSQKCLVPISVTGETNQDLDKKRLQAFNEAFDERYEKHSKWVISDESLRQKVCQILVQTIVPVYQRYMKNYGVLVEKDCNASRYVKHTAKGLEIMLSSLFQPTLRKICSTKQAQLYGKIRNVVTNQFRLTLTAI
ncbi:hypothetical protein FEM48_Zijuj10G0017200 [Ziziphus jujuba var. spinosa]|uniref:Exocyst subunit Exo70 family protein n=1 Tax=Ziziphus jujuba var. spinosa TaxID=714518 RepID=A0A978UKJ8_ZIZJJ|nr:hypothetical protein FEM48_Zijuj10G0017200 [Ziziphus jujuba var. spinosa]